MLQVNAGFACNFLTTECEKQFLKAVITLTYPVLAMVHLQWFTCDESLAMATRHNRHIMLYELSLERL